jgi:hypothetical protein
MAGDQRARLESVGQAALVFSEWSPEAARLPPLLPGGVGPSLPAGKWSRKHVFTAALLPSLRF